METVVSSPARQQPLQAAAAAIHRQWPGKQAQLQ